MIPPVFPKTPHAHVKHALHSKYSTLYILCQVYFTLIASHFYTYPNLSPFFTFLSGVIKITPPSLQVPKIKTSDMKFAICFGGKFTTVKTCLPNSSSSINNPAAGNRGVGSRGNQIKGAEAALLPVLPPRPDTSEMCKSKRHSCFRHP